MNYTDKYIQYLGNTSDPRISPKTHEVFILLKAKSIYTGKIKLTPDEIEYIISKVEPKKARREVIWDELLNIPLLALSKDYCLVNPWFAHSGKLSIEKQDTFLKLYHKR